jgi:hypothetical protein
MSTWLELSVRIGYIVIYASAVLIALTVALDMIRGRRRRK